ncbi:MAG: hypothetical protein IJZ80_05435 [Clostridia bacterium]|nr:hypothetical protein [Clostridia bacterium]
MKKVFFKAFLLCMAICMLMSLATGCEKDPSTEEGTEESESNAEVVHIVTPVNLGGKEFHFAVSKWYEYEPLKFTDIYVETYTGDYVQDAAYERNMYMEEFFNCSISMSEFQESELATKLEQNAMAGDQGFDFVLFRGEQYTAAVNGGYLASVEDFGLDTENPWWDSNAIEAMTLNGRCYGLVGDVTINHLLAVHMTCFNKDLVENYSAMLENPYELVESGKWTLDKMIAMAKSIANDTLDGVDGMGANDLWGIHYTRDNVQGLLVSCGVRVVELNADNKPTLTIASYQSQVQDILTKLYDETFATDTIGRVICKAENSDTEYFDEGNVLFLLTATHNASALRQSEVNYGILPYPKSSETGDYISNAAGTYYSILGIPTNNQNYNQSAAFLEAYAAQGYQNVRPQFYENVLLRKVGRDDESYEMLKFIFENLTYDIGCMFGIINAELSATSDSQDPIFTGVVAKNRLKWKTNLDKFLEAYDFS